MPKSESWAPPICRISVESNAAFIAGANPSEVLDLIADRDALCELAELRSHRIIELATELNKARDEIEALREELGGIRAIGIFHAKALKSLTFAARTTGGTAGRDAVLMMALDHAEKALSIGGIGAAYMQGADDAMSKEKASD